MSKKGGIGKFIAGAAIGAGLGILFAPKKGSETRKELKQKLDELLEQAKNIDLAEVKKEFNRKVEDIKMDLVDLDKEKALEIAKEKGTPILKKTASEILDKVVKVSKETQKKLTDKEEKK